MGVALFIVSEALFFFSDLLSILPQCIISYCGVRCSMKTFLLLTLFANINIYIDLKHKKN